MLENKVRILAIVVLAFFFGVLMCLLAKSAFSQTADTPITAADTSMYSDILLPPPPRPHRVVRDTIWSEGVRRRPMYYYAAYVTSRASYLETWKTHSGVVQHFHRRYYTGESVCGTGHDPIRVPCTSIENMQFYKRPEKL